jgi:hypothetical protein
MEGGRLMEMPRGYYADARRLSRFLPIRRAFPWQSEKLTENVDSRFPSEPIEILLEQASARSRPTFIRWFRCPSRR